MKKKKNLKYAGCENFQGDKRKIRGNRKLNLQDASVKTKYFRVNMILLECIYAMMYVWFVTV